MYQCFREHRQSYLWLPSNAMSFGEQREKIRSEYPCSCSMMDRQALVELLDALLRLSLLCQCPATQNSTVCHPERKSLFRRHRQGGFSTLLGQTHLTAALMEYSSHAQDKTQAVGVRMLLRQRHRLLAPRQPLLRIAQGPQRPGGKAMAHHTSIRPIKEHPGTVLLRVVQGYSLRKMRVRRGYRTQEEQRPPQGTTRHYEHDNILGLLRQGQELLA